MPKSTWVQPTCWVFSIRFLPTAIAASSVHCSLGRDDSARISPQLEHRIATGGIPLSALTALMGELSVLFFSFPQLQGRKWHKNMACLNLIITPHPQDSLYLGEAARLWMGRQDFKCSNTQPKNPPHLRGRDFS